MKRLFIFIVFSMIFLSCVKVDSNVHYHYYFVNHTDQDLYVGWSYDSALGKERYKWDFDYNPLKGYDETRPWYDMQNFSKYLIGRDPFRWWHNDWVTKKQREHKTIK